MIGSVMADAFPVTNKSGYNTRPKSKKRRLLLGSKKPKAGPLD
jgi:hypothetical protein